MYSMNKIFWEFVKKTIQTKNVDCKPCHYYAAHKGEVIKQFKELKKDRLDKDTKLKKETK